ncbi:glycosyltransferase, partial [Patescibacteria group bacterium]|nr:glycosyltransferase [Patescibacteria group bacterium]
MIETNENLEGKKWSTRGGSAFAGKNLHIGLLFSYGLSLEKWDEAGLLARDTQLYTELMVQGAKISFITYGDKSEQNIGNKLGLSVISNTKKLYKPFYYLFLNIIKYRELKKVDIIKSHQFIGVWPAVVMKIFFGKIYIARGGYIPSFFAKNSNKKSIRSYVKYIFAVVDEYMACKFADVVVVPSQEEIDYLKKKYNLKDKKAKINTNWIDTDLFKPDLNIKKKSNSVIFVGRFEEQKNPLIFLKSIKD